MAFAEVLERGWIPLVVIACGGLAGSRVGSGLDSETPSAYSNSSVTDTVFAPKSVVYDVFGPVGTVADISYFDVNSEPRRVGRARLPWSWQITANVPAVISNVVAQGDSNSIGCRTVVNGQVKAERISNEVNAYTHCMVKGA